MGPVEKENFKDRMRMRLNREVYLALKSLRNEFLVFRQHRKGVKAIQRNGWGRPAKLNLAWGVEAKKGYLNVCQLPGGDLNLDLRKGLFPFEPNCCDRIFSEHFFQRLEHMEYRQIGYPSDLRRVLAECLRVLKPGGTLSFSVPDAEWALRDYSAGIDAPFFRTVREGKWFPGDGLTRMEAINHFFRQAGDHRYMYDFECMSDILRKVGFTDITRRAYDPAEDTDSREVGSLFMSARKPSLVSLKNSFPSEAANPQSV